MRYGMKDEASFSNILYFSSISMQNTDCKYSRPFNKADGLISKNRRVIHFKIRSKLAIVALPLLGKSWNPNAVSYIIKGGNLPRQLYIHPFHHRKKTHEHNHIAGALHFFVLTYLTWTSWWWWWWWWWLLLLLLLLSQNWKCIPIQWVMNT
jgi:hypothetical protein